MTNQKEKLFEQYKSANIVNQALLSYLLRARIASGLENNDSGSGQIIDDIKIRYPQLTDFDPSGIIWSEAAQNFNQLVDLDPETAFNLSLKISLLPFDTDRENIYSWVRSDGPLNLAHPGLRPQLENILITDPSASQFLSKISQYMDYSITGYTPDQAFSDPYCFLKFAATYFASKLSGVDIESSQKLHTQALQVLHNPETLKIFQYYHRLPDISLLVSELENL